MATWSDLRVNRPDLAEGGRRLLYRHGVGLAFLATVRPDNAPRLHPFCPLLRDDAVFGFILPSPKQRDLHRDGRYAMHSFPTDNNEDAFYLSGRARHVDHADIRTELSAQFVEERAAFKVPPPEPDHHLFEFDIDVCLLTLTQGFGDFQPYHKVWRSPP
jgi:hypothetical protein